MELPTNIVIDSKPIEDLIDQKITTAGEATTQAIAALANSKADKIHRHAPADVDGLDAYIDARIPDPQVPTGPVAQVNESSEIPFDGGTQFTGTDAEKWRQMIQWQKDRASGVRPDVRMPARRVTVTDPLPTIAGIRLTGSRGPAREFNTGPQINYAGPSGSAFFQQYKNSGYSYPSNGVVRDMSFDGIQFSGATDRYLFPDVTGFDSNKVQWYTSFNNCGFVGFRHGLWGYADGLVVSGVTHVQAVVDTFFKYAGSENWLFGDGSLIDSAQASWLTADKPFVEMFGSKWTIGGAMISARNKSYQLLVSGGDSGRCIGTYFDSPDSAPTEGAQVRVTGGDGLTLTGCNFKGGDGVSVTGGKSVNITGCTFGKNRGILTVGSGFTGKVRLMGNEYVAGTPKVIRVSSLAQISYVDPEIQILNLSGQELRKAA